MMTAQMNLMNFDTPAMHQLDVGRCKARPINYATAARVVETYHYAHRIPSIMVSIGMYVDDTLAGVCTYGMMASPNAQKSICGEKYASNTLELNRLFVFDWAGRNSESWLIGQSFLLLKKLWPDYFILVSFADTEQKHIGYVYQATNWIYTGISYPGGNGNYMLVDGVKMTTKNAYDRYGSQGKKELERMGFDVYKPEGTNKHRYVYFLGNKTLRKKLLKALRYNPQPYPK